DRSVEHDQEPDPATGRHLGAGAGQPGSADGAVAAALIRATPAHAGTQAGPSTRRPCFATAGCLASSRFLFWAFIGGVRPPEGCLTPLEPGAIPRAWCRPQRLPQKSSRPSGGCFPAAAQPVTSSAPAAGRCRRLRPLRPPCPPILP